MVTHLASLTIQIRIYLLTIITQNLIHIKALLLTPFLLIQFILCFLFAFRLRNIFHFSSFQNTVHFLSTFLILEFPLTIQLSSVSIIDQVIYSLKGIFRFLIQMRIVLQHGNYLLNNLLSLYVKLVFLNPVPNILSHLFSQFSNYCSLILSLS